MLDTLLLICSILLICFAALQANTKPDNVRKVAEVHPAETSSEYFHGRWILSYFLTEYHRSMITEELRLLRLHVGGDRREDKLLRGAVRQVREIPSDTIPCQLLKIICCLFLELFNIKMLKM